MCFQPSIIYYKKGLYFNEDHSFQLQCIQKLSQEKRPSQENNLHNTTHVIKEIMINLISSDYLFLLFTYCTYIMSNTLNLGSFMLKKKSSNQRTVI